MPMMKALGLDKLSVADRIALIDELEESLPDHEPGSHLSNAQKAELDRRIAEADADPDGGMPVEQVMAEVFDRLRQVRR